MLLLLLLLLLLPRLRLLRLLLLNPLLLLLLGALLGFLGRALLLGTLARSGWTWPGSASAASASPPRHATTAALLAADPNLPNDPAQDHLFSAACAAARAGHGDGDAAQLDAAERTPPCESRPSPGSAPSP